MISLEGLHQSLANEHKKNTDALITSADFINSVLQLAEQQELPKDIYRSFAALRSAGRLRLWQERLGTPEL